MCGLLVAILCMVSCGLVGGWWLVALWFVCVVGGLLFCDLLLVGVWFVVGGG